MVLVIKPRAFAFSIATHIRMVLIGFAVFISILTLSSIIAYRDMQSVVQQLVGEQIPAIAPLLKIDTAGRALLSNAMALQVTEQEAFLNFNAQQFEQQMQDLKHALVGVNSYDPDPKILEDLNTATIRLMTEAVSLIEVSQQESNHSVFIQEQMKLFEEAYFRLINGVDALIQGPSVNLMAAVDEALERGDDPQTIESSLRYLLRQGIGNIRRMGEAKAEVHLLYAAAQQIISGSITARELTKAEEDFAQHAQGLEWTLAPRINTDPSLAGLHNLGQMLIKHGNNPDDGLITLEQTGLNLRQKARQHYTHLTVAIPAFRQALQDLYYHISNKVSASETKTIDGIERNVTLFAISAVSLLLVMLGFGWLYVNRAIAAPLRRLGQAASSIEAGQFNHPIMIEGRGEVGQLAKAIMALRDRSLELVRLRQKMLSGEDSSTLQDKLRVQLFTDLIEDLRIPIHRMQRSVQLVQSIKYLPQVGAVRDCLDQLERASGDLHAHLEQGFDLAQFWNGEMVLQPVSCDLVQLAEDSIAQLGLSLDQKQINKKNQETVTQQIALDLPPVLADPIRLRHAIVQLLVGAIQASGTAHLSINLTAEENIVISIHDHQSLLNIGEIEQRLLGLDRYDIIGRTDHQRSRLWSVRTPTSSLNRTLGFGHGLGLLLCSAVARAHDGYLTIEKQTTSPRGSIVTLTLPSTRCLIFGSVMKTNTSNSEKISIPA